MSKIIFFFKKYSTFISLAVITILILNQITFHLDKIPYPGGDIVQFSFEKKFLVKSLFTDHVLPFFNYYSFAGVPFVAANSPAVFYPINILYLFLPINQTFAYVFVLDVFLIGVFCFLYGRQIGLSKYTSFLFSIFYMFSGVVIPRFFGGHIFFIDTLVWFPLVLYLYERYLNSENLLFTFISGIPIALMFLAGGIQLALYSICALSSYAFLRVISETKEKRKIKKFVILIFTSVAMGIVLSAVQVFPSMEFTRFSTRSNGISFTFASAASMHPKQLIMFILPLFFGSSLNNSYWGVTFFNESLGYIGIVPLASFTLFLLFVRKNKFFLTFSILIVLSILYSFGKYFPLFYLAYKYLPWFNSFRVSTRILFITSFFLSAFGCYGIDYLLKGKFSKKASNKIFILFSVSIVLATFGVITALFLRFYSKGFDIYESFVLRHSYAVGLNHNIIFLQFDSDLLFMCSILLFFSLLSLFFLKRKINKQTFKIFLFLVVFINSFWLVNIFIKTSKETVIYHNLNTADFLRKDKSVFRVYDFSGSLIQFLGRMGIEQTGGSDSFQLGRYRRFLWLLGDHYDVYEESFFLFKNTKNNLPFDLTNTKYVISQTLLNDTNLKLVKTISNDIFQNNHNVPVYIYRNQTYLPRAFIIPNAEVVPSDEMTLQILKSKNFDPKNLLTLDAVPGISLINKRTAGNVWYQRINANKISLRVNLSDSGFLFLSEVWYPGWKVYESGKELKLLRADYTFMAIPLKKGIHAITIVYNPKAFIIGSFISLFGILILVVAVLFFSKI